MKVMLLPSAPGAGPLQYLTTLLVDGVVAIDAGCLGLYGTPAEQNRVKNVFLTHAAHRPRRQPADLFGERLRRFG